MDSNEHPVPSIFSRLAPGRRQGKNKLQVVTHGELLVDLVSAHPGLGLREATTFVKAAGGAPANVAVGLARLGVSSAFMGKVGDDEFGRFLADTLRRHGVDLRGLRFEPRARTALAFVALKPDGEREFTFYRNPSADMLFTAEEVDETLLNDAAVFHFGSISLASEPSRTATFYAATLAHRLGLVISFDPNLRLPLWESEDAVREQIARGWQTANIVKLSEDELAFLTGETDVERGVAKVPLPDLLVVTLGARGCFYATTRERAYVAGFPVVCRDATGAGDGFMAGLLAGLLNAKPGQNLPSVLRVANAVGALATTKRGAIPAMPTWGPVRHLLNTGRDVALNMSTPRPTGRTDTSNAPGISTPAITNSVSARKSPGLRRG